MALRWKTMIRAGICGVIVASSGCRDVVPASPSSGDLRGVELAPASVVGQDGMGFNVVGIDSPELTETNVQQILSYAQTAGVKWVRFQMWWPEAHTARNVWSEWHRTRYHYVIDAFTNAGIQVMVTLKGTPPWACYGLNVSDCARDSVHVPDDLPAWAEFVRSVIVEYPKVNHWGIWNEPTDPGQFRTNSLRNPPMSIHDAYRELVLYAWSVKKDFPGKMLLAPEDGNPVFLDSILRTHAWAIDVITAHGYGYSWDVRNNVIGAADAIGRKYKPPYGIPIWLTETGDPVNPGINEPQPTDGQQASHITNVLNYMTGQTIVNWQKTFPWHLFGPFHEWDQPGFRYIHDVFTSNPIVRPAYWCYRRVALALPADPTCTDATECAKPPESPGPDPRPECLVARGTGPTRMRPNYSCAWNAIASGTTGLTYTWYVNGQEWPSNGSQFSFNSAYANNRVFQLLVTIRDTFGNWRNVGWNVSVTSTSPGCG